MKGLITTLCCVLFALGLKAQTTEDLEAYYTFNDSTAINEILNSGIDIGGNLDFVCGIERLAILFDGGSDEVVYLSPEAGLLLDDDDFTIGFFMSPAEKVGTQTIFSKKEACNDDNAFAVRYSSSSNTVTVELSENSSKKVVLTAQVDSGKCWQHITIVRSGATARLYLNGILKDTGSTLSRIDLENNVLIQVGSGTCVNTTDIRYEGALDEVRFYDRALTEKEIKGLYKSLYAKCIYS